MENKILVGQFGCVPSLQKCALPKLALISRTALVLCNIQVFIIRRRGVGIFWPQLGVIMVFQAGELPDTGDQGRSQSKIT